MSAHELFWERFRPFKLSSFPAGLKARYTRYIMSDFSYSDSSKAIIFDKD